MSAEPVTADTEDGTQQPDTPPHNDAAAAPDSEGGPTRRPGRQARIAPLAAGLRRPQGPPRARHRRDTPIARGGRDDARPAPGSQGSRPRAQAKLAVFADWAALGLFFLPTTRLTWSTYAGRRRSAFGRPLPRGARRLLLIDLVLGRLADRRGKRTQTARA